LRERAGISMIELPSVRLSELVQDLAGVSLSGEPTTAISSLSYNSAQVEPGALFFCVPGLKRDGHDFAGDAVERGAVALVVQHRLPLEVPQVLAADTRRAMGPIAARFFSRPSRGLLLAGITGTNGKTTSAYLAAWLLEASGLRTGLIGTVERRVGGVSRRDVDRTTPEALDLQRDLAGMVAAGDRAAVMEVSSHALELSRADDLVFAAVAFTNLTQDHLDFHGNLDAYYRAKARLFLDPVFADREPPAVINMDDPVGRRIARQVAPHRLLTFRVADGRAGAVEPADLELQGLKVTPAGIEGLLRVAGRAADRVHASVSRELHIPLLGRFNASNVLTALGLGLALGLDLDLMVEAVADFPGVPGRMQQVDAGQPFTVLVDYAHTPDSVENVLSTARDVCPGRVIALLGCGGDRDRTKRPRMGRALEEGADVAVVTSDNPRTEQPTAIIAEVLAGLEQPEKALVDADRRQAMRTALRQAAPGDIVLILGKGHESGQEINGRKIAFDDFTVACELLREQGWRAT